MDVGAKESKQKDWKLPDKKAPPRRLASYVEELTDLADNIVLLGGQTVVLVQKTTILPNGTSPLTETGCMV